MSRRLEDLDPVVRRMAEQFLRLAGEQGFKVMVTQTRRTFAEQAALYAKGRSAPGEPCRHAGEPMPRKVGTCPRHPLGATVTRADSGWSWHEYGLAFDVAEDDGTPWDIGKPGHSAEDDEWWNKLGELGESLGLEWGGRWKRPDLPHFEWRAGQTLAMMRDAAIRSGLLT